MSDEQTIITWPRFQDDCRNLAGELRGRDFSGIYGVPTGGCFVAVELGHHLGLPLVPTAVPGCLVVDDLVDSGATMARFTDPSLHKQVLYSKRTPDWEHPFGGVRVHRYVDGWVKFPWETDHGPEDAVVRLLQWVGQDPKRDGLLETPKRVTRALREMTSGYQEDPQKILGTVFEQEYDEVVILKDIPFTSLCEHHIAVFTGTADVGYIPGKVVGLSKLARLVDCFAKRLQLQERLTREVADSVMKYLDAKGVAVVIKAAHTCLSCRGVKKSGATMVTSVCLGVFRDDPSARAEFMSLVQR